MQLVSKIFNLCGHDPPVSQADRWTDRQTGQTTCDSKIALCTIVHRAVIIGKCCGLFQKYLCTGLMVAKANLVELDLSDNAFGPNGMNGLTDFLRSSSCYSLRELRLNNNGLGIQGGKVGTISLLVK